MKKGFLPKSLPWMILATLLALLLLATLVLDRSSWPDALIGDEATYLMQAESLAWDQDLLYLPPDYERFTLIHGFKPEGLILQSSAGREKITFGKPFFYAAYIAPFLRVSRNRGAFIANAFLLALAALTAARTLERRIGALAPLYVAVLIFASASFIYTFWVQAGLFLMCLVTLALSLAFAAEKEESIWIAMPRWLTVGVLLAMVGFSQPIFFVLFLPVLIALPRISWRQAAPALLIGVVALVAGAGAVQQDLTGSFSARGAHHRGFHAASGFPGVDFAASDWTGNLGPGESESVQTARNNKLDVRLWGWNTVYFLVGRHVGVIPYFFPLLLCFWKRPQGLVDWSLLAAVAMAILYFFHLQPFGFHGGVGTVGNSYFLPLYPALWFLIRRPIRGAWFAIVTFFAALFVMPLWAHPLASPFLAGGIPSHASPLAKCCLPFETTLSHLKVSGREDIIHRGLWIRFLGRSLQYEAEQDLLRLETSREGVILVGGHKPLEALEVELRAPPATRLFVGGAEVEQTEGRRWRITLKDPRAVHSMWWTRRPFFIYRLTLRTDAQRPVRLTLSAVPPDAVSTPRPIP